MFLLERGIVQQEVSRVPDSPAAGVSSSLVEALYRNVERFPGKTALVKKSGGKWRTLSYAELYARVERFAAGLAGLGVGEGSRVALMSKKPSEVGHIRLRGAESRGGAGAGLSDVGAGDRWRTS